MNPDFLLQVIVAIAGAIGVYGAIKSDLTRAIVLAEMAVKDSGAAHARISEHVEQHHTRGNHE